MGIQENPFALSAYFEMMQVIIKPSHRVLDGNVQIPEIIIRRNMNSSPDQKGYFQ
jgi:hypothetical protein